MTTPPEPPRDLPSEPPRDLPPEPGPPAVPNTGGAGAAPVDETPSWYSQTPGAPPASGYAVPGWGAAVPAPAGAAPVDDPLIPYDFSSLFSRMISILQRSWRSLLLIQVIGTFVPAVVMTVLVMATGLGGVVFGGGPVTAGTAPLTEEELTELMNLLLGAGLLVVLLALVTAYIGAAAVAASIWTVTRQAAGQPAPLGDAFRYGFARGLPLFGWNLLSGLCIGIGALCCLLPGLYLGVALSLIAPIVVFEGGNAFSRSFRLTHSQFWPTVGRVALLYVAYFAYTFVVGLPGGIVNLPMDNAALQLVLVGGAQLVTAALTVPAVAVVTVGLTVVYTELRAREGQLSTPQLAAELDRP